MPKQWVDATPHLWILITDPNPDTGEAVMVNVTTKQSYSDTTVTLKVGDHPYIRHDSTIFYADARTIKVAEAEKAITSGQKFITQHATCTPELLKRVQEGLHQSKFTPNKIRALCPRPTVEAGPTSTESSDSAE
jgi:hypothetical protein